MPLISTVNSGSQFTLTFTAMRSFCTLPQLLSKILIFIVMMFHYLLFGFVGIFLKGLTVWEKVI